MNGDHLQEVRVNRIGLPMWNENLPVHMLVREGAYEQEPWYRMLNHFASYRGLTKLQLHGGYAVCPEFFQVIINYPGTPFPFLREFELEFAAETADGRWFYERDDERIARSRADPEYAEIREDLESSDSRYSSSTESGEEEDTTFEDDSVDAKTVKRVWFRSLPRIETLMPLLMDASKAVECIPNLAKFILRLGYLGIEPSDLDLYPIVSRVFELWYLKAGMPRSSPRNLLNLKTIEHNLGDPYVPGDAAYLNRNRLYWRVGDAEIWDEVQAAWSATAGPDAKIVAMDEDCWKKNSWTNDIPVGYQYGYLGKY
jgi:hypothetical protein